MWSRKFREFQEFNFSTDLMLSCFFEVLFVYRCFSFFVFWAAVAEKMSPAVFISNFNSGKLWHELHDFFTVRFDVWWFKVSDLESDYTLRECVDESWIRSDIFTAYNLCTCFFVWKTWKQKLKLTNNASSIDFV